ncbi:ABC transporter ATP-binding protein [Halalkalibacter nanhaiisediminis]|uniref:Quaternary amine transport ATP-binding protein n=1 Tax=Halalkalibacter nanhaiisediminis TaxID=688079 RepID=A0A562QQJ9_9BACI|nr:ABC transporter ATP-binding protein [Halalkalibacter nanhaiisediminis]TWI58987.1 osmoprotectant transport system ATP-binding protein [Halalkalibacter nanhaiisediminis]
MITFQNVSKAYPDGTQAVQQFNLTVAEGEFFVLIGPSGCGKTTTLKMVNRLIEPTDGTIEMNGKPISSINIHELRWNIGYVLQQIALFPNMTVAENISVVPEMMKWSKELIEARVNELLEMVGLEPSQFRERKPSELSGGQQQRIGVARALAANPDILLMDEPFSALDPISREQLQEDIINLKKNIKKTIIFVTHDMDEALKLGDRICMMREGKIVQVGTPEELLSSPKDEFVATFIGDRKHTIVDKSTVNMVMKSIDNVQAEINEQSAIIPITATLDEAFIQLSTSEDTILYVEDEQQIVGTVSYKELAQLAVKGGVN